MKRKQNLLSFNNSVKQKKEMKYTKSKTKNSDFLDPQKIHKLNIENQILLKKKSSVLS